MTEQWTQSRVLPLRTVFPPAAGERSVAAHCRRIHSERAAGLISQSQTECGGNKSAPGIKCLSVVPVGSEVGRWV